MVVIPWIRNGTLFLIAVLVIGKKEDKTLGAQYSPYTNQQHILSSIRWNRNGTMIPGMTRYVSLHTR
ncbi:hypothetical protein B5X24_HaOG216519 [Helicoverpa armigera]|nr:hypothetical protein B5X24_HaOG216519 [Helicoverpa armigera]